MRYFAYGSNLCLGRLRKRTPSARFLAIAKLEGYKLQFHKTSIDGSGKADAFATGDNADAVWGVVFDIDDGEKAALDRAEGLGRGYCERAVDVMAPNGRALTVSMYGADSEAINSSLEPYSWYKRFVVEEARQHGLPREYVEAISETPSVKDANPHREAQNRTFRCSDLVPKAFPWVVGGWRTATAVEATAHWLTHTKGPLDPLFYEERWYWARLLARELRSAQGTFGDNWPLTKHVFMRDLLEENRQAVLDGSFPKSESIKAGFDPPAVIALVDRAGSVFVTDGLGRMFMALWHSMNCIDAYVFDEWSDRPLP